MDNPDDRKTPDAAKTEAEDQSAAYGWLGRVREPLRSAVFRTLSQILKTEDGRRILAEALTGQLATRPAVPAPSPAAAPPYPELGATPAAPTASRTPVFITARFRSGSTLMWNLFRQIEGCTSYYEPLNERRWFDPSARGDRVDRTHLGVSDYWREYAGLERLGAFYRQDWIDRHLYMDQYFWDPNLKAYVDTLVAAAPGRAVLQFNRVDFRLPWLRRMFPEARIVHLFRHPRDQWCSSLVDLKAFPKDATMASFAAHDHFYLLSWARDLRHHFPFLDPDREEHPYRLFYWIWKLSYLFGAGYAHASFGFEELVRKPDAEIARLMAAAAIDRYDAAAVRAVIADQKLGKWVEYADDGWFNAHESACEAVLADFLKPPLAG